ncbi:glucosyltransferase MdoH [Spiribacter salinus M19-40]|uniref:Glucans biosynthesis glucosyltransferase H n=1 Tax=Spiribacter salinus M19-40 TaxID=1260251 RepID=R4VP12_9GAMM|nr:glucans biosynthesis glucosyltransferase MdoH [Spiribacter salinus]AGM41228.1 glucosyltransferase MdoH [Spiribacter salinus M19-40]
MTEHGHTSWRLHEPGLAMRRLLMVLLVSLTAAVGISGMLTVLGPDGLSAIDWVVLSLFFITFTTTCLWFWTAIIGIVLRSAQLHPVTLGPEHPDAEDAPGLAPTAIVMPAFNEDMEAVAHCITATWRSLEATGETEPFDFFLLSDSSDPERQATEARTVSSLRARLGTGIRLYYRARSANHGRKPGNIRDFCERWGGHYRYMIVLDADSRMTGTSLLTLVRRMEANPQAGILQTVPLPVGQRTVLGRLQQLAASLHARNLAAGLAFWQGNSTNYWGHNAIVRLSDFLDCCGLPPLPGEAPLGGDIMSHDYVEAALMRRHDRGVYVLSEIEGSYEGMPGNLVDDLKRERRWCQGNLQHLRLLFRPGWRLISRLNFLVGALAYVNAPLWLALVGLGVGDAIIGTESVWLAAAGVQGGAVLPLVGLTVALLFLPKLLSIALAAYREPRGAYRRHLLVASGVEMVFALLRAPVMMVLYALYVVRIISGRPAGWSPQLRTQRTIPPHLAIQLGLPMACSALLTAALIITAAPAFLPWLIPVLLGPLLYPGLLYWTSLNAPASWLPSTPEEHAGGVPMNRRIHPDQRRAGTEASSKPVVPAECFQPMPLQPLSG